MSDVSLLLNVIGRDRTGPAFASVADGAKKLGGGIKLGLGAALGALGLGGGLMKFVNDARESAKVGRLTEAVVKSTGQAANLTADQVGDLATAISNKTGADDEAVQSGANMLLTFTNIKDAVGKGNDIFTQATATATDLAAAMNGGEVSASGLKTSSIQLGKALNDPIKGVGALSDVGVSFTAQQKDQIAAMVKAGDTMGAQKVILSELNKEFGGAAAAASDPMQKLDTIVGNLSEQIGGLLLPAVDKVATFLGNRVIPAVSQFVDSALKPAAHAVGVFFNALSGKSEMGEFSGKLQAVNNVGVKVGTWIRNDFIPAFSMVVTWVRDRLIPAVGAFAARLAADLKPALSAVIGGIREHLVPAVQGLIGKFQSVWPTIQTVLVVLRAVAEFIMTRVVPVIVSLYATYLSKLIGVLGTVFQVFWKVIGVIVSVVTTVGQAGAAFGRFVGAVGSAIGSAWSAVKTGIGNIVSTVKAFPGKAISAVGNLGSMLAQKGRDFIQGFINGIADAAKAIPGVIKDKVIGAAQSAIHGFGLFGSPSRLTAKYGRWWTEGFVGGIAQNSGKILDATREMLDVPAPRALAAGTGAGTASSAGTGGVQVASVGGRQVIEHHLVLSVEGHGDLIDLLRQSARVKGLQELTRLLGV